MSVITAWNLERNYELQNSPATILIIASATAQGQINTGSDGSDGALDVSSITYTTNVVLNMADHHNGIYQYTSINIPTNVTVTFRPNTLNTPVVWLVQNSCLISGNVSVSGNNYRFRAGVNQRPAGFGGLNRH